MSRKVLVLGGGALLAAGIAAAVVVSRSSGLAPGSGCGAPGTSCHVSPEGSNGNPCTALKPCSSFDRAYRLARPGETVVVGDGGYGDQKISREKTKTSPRDVVFEPAAGASPSVQSLKIDADHVTVKDLKVTQWFASGSDITMKGLKTQTFLTNAAHINVVGGDYGNYAPPCAAGSTYPAMDNPTVTPYGGVTPTDVVIKGVRFHDMSSRNCHASHMDCLQVAGAVRVTIADNTFARCQVQDLILTGDFGVMKDIVVERNHLGAPVGGGESLDWNDRRDCPGAIVRDNIFVTGIELDCSRDSSAQLYGNVLPRLSLFDCGTKKAVQHDNIGRSGEAVPACGRGSRIEP
jgi:hypothetical protein